MLPKNRALSSLRLTVGPKEVSGENLLYVCQDLPYRLHFFFPVTPRGENPLLQEGTASSHHSEMSVPLAQKHNRAVTLALYFQRASYAGAKREILWW